MYKKKSNSRPSKDHLKPVFLEEFKKHGTIGATCRAIKLDRKTIFAWRERDPDFDDAYIEVDSMVTETIERRAIEAATKRDHHKIKVKCNGIVKKKIGEECEHEQTIRVPCELGADPAMMIFLLKCRNKRYRPAQHHQINVNYVKESADFISNVIKTHLPNFCPHCHGTLAIKAKLVEEIGNATSRIEKGGLLT